MGTLFEQVAKKSADTHAPGERLARVLIEELDASLDRDIERLWVEEFQRRYEAYLKGELKSVSGEEAMSRARRRFT